jgi:hypothetical protein
VAIGVVFPIKILGIWLLFVIFSGIIQVLPSNDYSVSMYDAPRAFHVERVITDLLFHSIRTHYPPSLTEVKASHIGRTCASPERLTYKHPSRLFNLSPHCTFSLRSTHAHRRS